MAICKNSKSEIWVSYINNAYHPRLQLLYASNTLCQIYF